MKSRLALTSLALGAALLLVGTACHKSSDSAPPNPPQPPTPPAQPLVLKGTVVDRDTKAPLPASVAVTKTDGSAVSTLTANANGEYQIDVTAMTDTSLRLTATNGAAYGTVTEVATIDRTVKQASVAQILLPKLPTGTTGTVTAATGGTVATPPTAEAKTTTNLSVAVPPGAVTTNTPITVTAVPITMLPAAVAPSRIVVAASVAPANLTFNVDVPVTFPLSSGFDEGEQLDVVKLNATTNKWEANTAKAVVNNTNFVAVLNVRAGGTYAIQFNEDSAALSVEMGETETTSFALAEQTFTRYGATGETDKVALNCVRTTTTPVPGGLRPQWAPTFAWIWAALGLPTQTVNYTKTYSLPWNPPSPEPAKPNLTSVWRLKATYVLEDFTSTTPTVFKSKKTGQWTSTVSLSQTEWRMKAGFPTYTWELVSQ